MGLKNHRNLCYLNTLVQLYFWIPQVRKVILEFTPAAASKSLSTSPSLGPSHGAPRSPSQPHSPHPSSPSMTPFSPTSPAYPSLMPVRSARAAAALTFHNHVTAVPSSSASSSSSSSSAATSTLSANTTTSSSSDHGGSADVSLTTAAASASLSHRSSRSGASRHALVDSQRSQPTSESRGAPSSAPKSVEERQRRAQLCNAVECVSILGTCFVSGYLPSCACVCHCVSWTLAL